MTANRRETPAKMSPEQAVKQINEGRALIFDVREPHEYRHEHISGAVSVPLEKLSAEHLPQGKTAILYCGAGKRSCQAAERLMASSHADVVVVDGGIVGWKSVGLPTERSLDSYSSDEIKAVVAERYGRVATAPHARCEFPVGRQFAESVGYEAASLDRLPNGLWESFTGAGNPQSYIDARPGETLLDLGCGAGLDLCLYAERVGPTGKLFGLDLSEAMLDKARNNLASVGIANVEFLHAAADAIPLPDDSVDLVTSNGIYNLSPDKDAVMREVARVLKPGGRTVFAEIVLKSELPPEVRRGINDWFRCIGGALVRDDFLSRMTSNGLVNPQLLSIGRNARTRHELAVCAIVRAEKP
ncbi:MAG TPA: methyltransferase domain-containing protein [Pirellulales bacterium]|nr:methyltransferase domain-containing protein [Pirellulales bacterium]